MPRFRKCTVAAPRKSGNLLGGRASLEPLETRRLFAVTFAAAVNTQVALGDFPVSASVSADLDGDGVPELIVARTNLQVQIFRGTAAGNLNVSSILPAGGNFIAVGDFNGDSKLDLATGNGIYPGNGDGTVSALLTGFALPTATVEMYAQDVNADGKLDLVCATYSVGQGVQTNATPAIGLSVLLGNGDGTFAAAINTTVGAAASLTQADGTIAFGDFNKDGKLDAVTPFGIMNGNGDGTFAAATALPHTGAVTGTTPIPSLPLFAVGDFNGDGNTDLITLPFAANNGSVELFLGSASGHLTDNGPIVVAAGQPISALTAAALTSSSNTDLLAGISTPAGTGTDGTPTVATANIAALLNSGGATFAAPQLFTASGPPVAIETGDFNADGNLDLLSVDEAAGTVVTGTNGVTLGVTGSVYLNAQVAAVVPALSLKTSLNPVVAGNSVTYTATVAAPSGSATTAAQPTGTVSFYNGATLLGAAALTSGKATLSTVAAGVGAQAITFVYGGDINYAGATSAALSQRVLQTSAKVPLLIPTLGAITLPAQFLSGDKGTAVISLANGGAGKASGRVDVNFYLSTTGAIDSSAIALSVPALQNYRVSIASGGTKALTAKFTLGDYAVANYFLVVQVAAASGLTADEVTSTALASSGTFASAGTVFGTIGAHKNHKLRIADALGNIGNFSLTGPGLGTVTQVNGQTNISLTGTTTASHLTLSSRGNFVVNNIEADAAIVDFAAPRATVTGDMNFRGGVKRLTLQSAASTSGLATTLNLGASTFKPTISLGDVGNLMLLSPTKLYLLSAASWRSGAIDAPAINSLNVRGAFAADVNTHGSGKLTTAIIGSITGGAWAIAGGLDTLSVRGAASDVAIYVGTDSGGDDTLGTADDIFGPGAIFSLYVRGDVSSTTIAVGVRPASGQSFSSGLSLLANGGIRAMRLRGTVSDDSRFIAPNLPVKAVLNSFVVATATDSHFQV